MRTTNNTQPPSKTPTKAQQMTSRHAILANFASAGSVEAAFSTKPEPAHGYGHANWQAAFSIDTHTLSPQQLSAPGMGGFQVNDAGAVDVLVASGTLIDVIMVTGEPDQYQCLCDAVLPAGTQATYDLLDTLSDIGLTRYLVIEQIQAAPGFEQDIPALVVALQHCLAWMGSPDQTAMFAAPALIPDHELLLHTNEFTPCLFGSGYLMREADPRGAVALILAAKVLNSYR